MHTATIDHKPLRQSQSIATSLDLFAPEQA
ncbi:Uncharacterised protein [Vibrio cholerae]|nr:Uncharacterised protein [Vibrio cholerae]